MAEPLARDLDRMLERFRQDMASVQERLARYGYAQERTLAERPTLERLSTDVCFFRDLATQAHRAERRFYHEADTRIRSYRLPQENRDERDSR